MFSFNGNKIVTSGGGGAIVTNDIELGVKAKHLSTTAKVPHPFEYVHDEIGYNFRMPNLNAALACAQIEQLESFIQNKRNLALDYSTFFETKKIDKLWMTQARPDGNIAKDDVNFRDGPAGRLYHELWHHDFKNELIKKGWIIT